MDNREVLETEKKKNPIEESIETLLLEIEEKQKQIKKLKNFQKITKNGMTEQEYHIYCGTEMRYSDELGKALLNVFPFLEYKGCSSNGFNFQVAGQEKVNGVKFSVSIPSYDVHNVVFIIPDLILNEDTIANNVNIHYAEREKKLTRELDKIKHYQKAESLSDRAETMFPYRYRSNVFGRLWAILRVVRPNYDKELIKRKEELTGKLDELNRIKEQEIKCKKEKYNTQQEVIRKYAELFLKWTKVVYIQLPNYTFCSLKCFYEDGELKVQMK